MEIIVITIPQPLPCIIQIFLQQMYAHLTFKDNLSYSCDAPNGIENVTRTQQERFKFTSSSHCHYIFNKLIDNCRRTEIPRYLDFK